MDEASNSSNLDCPEDEGSPPLALHVQLICETIFSFLDPTTLKSCRLVCWLWNRFISCDPPSYREDSWAMKFIDGHQEFNKYVSPELNRSPEEPKSGDSASHEQNSTTPEPGKTKRKTVKCFPFSKLLNLSKKRKPKYEKEQLSVATSQPELQTPEDLTRNLCLTNVLINFHKWMVNRSNCSPLLKQLLLPCHQQVTTLIFSNCTITPSAEAFVALLVQLPQLRSLGFHKGSSIRLGSQNYNTDEIQTRFNLKKLTIRHQYAYSPCVVFLLHLFGREGSTLEEVSILVDIDDPEESKRTTLDPERDTWWFKFLKSGFSIGLMSVLAKNKKTLRSVNIRLNNRHPAEKDDKIDMKFIHWWHVMEPEDPEASPLESISINCPSLKENNNYAFPEWVMRLPRLKKVTMNSINLPITRFGWYIRELLSRFECLAAKGCDINLGVNLSLESDVRKFGAILRSPLLKKTLTRLNMEYNNPNYNYQIMRFLFPLPFISVPNRKRSDDLYKKMQKLQINFEPGICTYQPYDLRIMGRIFPNLTSLKIYNYIGLKNKEFERRRSSTSVCDHLQTDADLQLILRTFTNLRTIHIEADLEAISDDGITGWNGGSLAVSFSNLPALRKISLLGLGSKITNDSLKYGFNDLYHLKRLHLSGYTKIDMEGIEWFKKSQYGSRVQLEVKTFQLVQLNVNTSASSV